MKRAFFAFLLIIACLRSGAQVSAFGEFSLSAGSGRYLEHSDKAFHVGGTTHAVAGLQYGIFAVNAGLGFVYLTDQREEPYFMSSTDRVKTEVDFPVGLSIRLPMQRLFLAAGADISGFLGSSLLMIAPHVDVLFGGNRGYRGLFIKAFTHLEKAQPSYRPFYIGIGFKTTFG